MPEMPYSRPAAKGWYSPHNGPYGAPRGNRVLAAKRITGPSAERIMRLAMMFETCDHPGCMERAIIARDVTASVTTIKRHCVEHATGPSSSSAHRVSDLLKFPWQ
jgi:hypothetical protein